MPRGGEPSWGIGIAPAEGIEPPSDRLTAGRLAIRPRWNETPSCNRALILFCRIERSDDAREGRRRRCPPSFSFGIGFQGTRPADAGSKFGRADPEVPDEGRPRPAPSWRRGGTTRARASEKARAHGGDRRWSCGLGGDRTLASPVKSRVRFRYATSPKSGTRGGRTLVSPVKSRVPCHWASVPFGKVFGMKTFVNRVCSIE